MHVEQPFMDIGRRVMALRGAQTQAELAAKLGVDRKTIVRWEAGERLPDGGSLLSLAKLCGADLNLLLTGEVAGRGFRVRL